MVKYCELFWTFFKIGTFTIGGGYAMIPQMEHELVDRHAWLSREEFLNLLAISQSMPGVFAVNMAVAVGSRLRGFRGAFLSVAGNILVPVALILLLAICFRQFRQNQVVASIFMGLRPAVVALIAAPVFRLASTARVSWSNCWIPILSALLIWAFGVSPIFVILGAALMGFLWGRFGKEVRQ